MCGIYIIINIVNNKVYIGQSTMIEKRWLTERSGNCGAKLKNAFQKYGIDNFQFSVLEECSKEELNEKEIAYIKLYNSIKNGYNITVGGEGHRLYENSEENRKQKEREYKTRNKEKLQMLNKQYRLLNKDKKKDYDKTYRENNKNKILQYKKNNKDKIDKLRKKSYNKEKETICFYENKFTNLNALRAKLQYKYGSGKDAKKYIVLFKLTKLNKSCIISKEILNKQISPNLAV